jgi:putative DNA primase/helicase
MNNIVAVTTDDLPEAPNLVRLVHDAEPQVALPPEFSDEALALRFADAHAHDLRFIAAQNRWMRWTGAKWEADDTLFARHCARNICRDAAAECEVPRTQSGIASSRTVYATENLAKADLRLAARVDQWDADKWILNTPVGVIDLRGAPDPQPHKPEHYLTKSTAVGPGGDCPRWLAFLDRVTGGDRELQAFLRRIAGYALTGDTGEHALFFGFGLGANGKSIFTNTIAGIMGDYHVAAGIETFTASSGDRHPTELARLWGARLVTASETEEGRRWAESKIKQLTGGDRISARFMMKDFFEFQPQFKLLIVGNHKPGLRSVDEAIRRRFKLIPFTVTIPPEERDPDLFDKLKEEWPGILSWMLDGCSDWQEQRLAPPASVTAATAEYLEAEDALAAWVEECCSVDAQEWTNTTTLFGSWSEWAAKAGEFVGTQRRFAQALEAHGYQSMRKMTGRGFNGIAIKPVSTVSSYAEIRG